jgi:predicted RNA-binding Zn ribbon-like protein
MTDSSRAEYRIVGGHRALDLVNTVSPRIPGRAPDFDYLATPADLLAWSRRCDVLDNREEHAVLEAWDASPALSGKVLNATLEIREAAFDVLGPRAAHSTADGSPADQRGEGSAFERLMLRWSAAAARSMLVPSPDGAGHGVAELLVGTSPVHLVPDRLVVAVIELIRTVDLRQLRACPVSDGGCGWLFLDRSRNGSRRWCAMADCGTQAKIRRLGERRRATSVMA